MNQTGVWEHFCKFRSVINSNSTALVLQFLVQSFSVIISYPLVYSYGK